MSMDRKTQHCQHVTSSQPEFWILVGTKTLKNGLTDTNNLILIFTQRNKGPGKANTILKNKLGGLTLSTSRLTIRLQESREWFWWKSRQTDQWNRSESPEIDTHKSDLRQRGKGNTMEEDSLFKKWYRNNWTSTCKTKWI